MKPQFVVNRPMIKTKIVFSKPKLIQSSPVKSRDRLKEQKKVDQKVEPEAGSNAVSLVKKDLTT